MVSRCCLWSGRWRRLACAVTVAVMMSSCEGGGEVESAEGDAETIVEEAEEEDFEGLVVNEPFEGTAVVTEVISPRAFELFDTLVVSRVPLDLRADERVRVRGLIRDTTVVELEEQWDVDLADAVADAHDGGLLIVADDVTPVDFPEPLD